MKNTKILLLFSTTFLFLTTINLSLDHKVYAGTSVEESPITSNVTSESSTSSTVGQQNAIIQSPGSILQFNNSTTSPYQGCSGVCFYTRLGFSNSNGNALNLNNSVSNIQGEIGLVLQFGSVEGKQIEATSKIAMMEQDRLDTQLNANLAKDLGKLIKSGDKAEAIGQAINLYKRLGFASHLDLLKTMGANW